MIFFVKFTLCTRFSILWFEAVLFFNNKYILILPKMFRNYVYFLWKHDWIELFAIFHYSGSVVLSRIIVKIKIIMNVYIALHHALLKTLTHKAMKTISTRKKLNLNHTLRKSKHRICFLLSAHSFRAISSE